MATIVGTKMHLISILMMAVVAAAFIPEAVSGECYDGAASATLTTSKPWIDAAIAKHNEYRARHGACPLKFNQKLSEIAQNWANKLTSLKSLKHSQTECLGENLALIPSPYGSDKSNSSTAADLWYNEIKDFDFHAGKSRTGDWTATGHLTQVLWKDSREIGIAYASYKDENFAWHVVSANYFPAGNYPNLIKQNVLPGGSPLPAECNDFQQMPVKDVQGDFNAGGSRSFPSATNWNCLLVLSVALISAVSRAFIL